MPELLTEARREVMPSVEAAESGDEDKLTLELLGKAVVRLMKQDISERYAKTRKITDEDWEFCEKIDWHPVDELPLKESFVKELEKVRKEPSIRLKSVSEVFK